MTASPAADPDSAKAKAAARPGVDVCSRCPLGYMIAHSAGASARVPLIRSGTQTIHHPRFRQTAFFNSADESQNISWWASSLHRLVSPAPVNSHCQTTNTRHPSARSSASLRASRSLFATAFCSQNSAFEAGRRPSRHSWACQKQPCTKMTALCLGNTRSGRPGRPQPPSRYRRPRRCSSLRTSTSRDVSLCLTRRMRSERCSVVRESAMRLSYACVVSGAQGRSTE